MEKYGFIYIDQLWKINRKIGAWIIPSLPFFYHQNHLLLPHLDMEWFVTLLLWLFALF